MSEEGDTFWVSLSEKFLGLIVTIIGALLLYFTVTSISALAAFSGFFGFLSIALPSRWRVPASGQTARIAFLLSSFNHYSTVRNQRSYYA